MTGLADQVDGEMLQAAAYARVPTAVRFTHWLTPLGNYFIARPAARAAAAKKTEETGVPLDAAVVLGLSNVALHVWSADPMLDQVHDHLGHVPLGGSPPWIPLRGEPGRTCPSPSRGAT